MSDRHTSRVFQAQRKLYDALSEPGLFPAHPMTGKMPVVTFTDSDPDKGAEKVSVLVDVEEADMEWARLGAPGRDEFFVLMVVVRSFVEAPGRSEIDVHERLEVLADVIQDVLFDREARNTVALGFDGEVPTGYARTPLPVIAPGGTGPIGWFTISIRLQAQI